MEKQKKTTVINMILKQFRKTVNGSVHKFVPFNTIMFSFSATEFMIGEQRHTNRVTISTE